MKNREIWIYDIETLKDIFTYTAINIDTEEVVKYVICELRDDRIKLKKHLLVCQGQIGFNNINFDYPIIHLLTQIIDTNSINIPETLHIKANDIINNQNENHGYNIHQIRQKEWLIPQLDLFKLWHYNNKARATSLKALQISMNYPNVMDMPDIEEVTLKTIDTILEYNLNDVLSTFEFYKRSTHKILLRKELNKKYDLNCQNYPDVRIGEELLLKLYCEKTNSDYWTIKDLRTKRNTIKLKECILPYIEFKSKELNSLLDTFNNAEITNTKGELEHSIIFNNIKIFYGLGGIHAATKPGVYIPHDDYIIKSCDVASLYPSIAIINNFYPEHLGIEFCKVYEDILNKRIEAKAKGDTNISDAFKLSLNGTYGKSSSEYSFLYDPKFTMQITLNGQLLLSMLIETLYIMIPEIKFLLINTDGLEVIISKSKEKIYYRVCETWEKLTKLTLEYTEYQKIILGDVNNYIARTIDNKIKSKGRFEVDKIVGNEPAYHKDNSFRIIPLALQNYFINDIPIEYTILSHKNIYDFCGRQKFKGNDYGQTHYLFGSEEIIHKEQRNTRYYISTNGSTFIKHYEKGNTEFINKGYKINIFNKFIEKPIKEYNINYQFYINECYKEINNIIKLQLELF